MPGLNVRISMSMNTDNPGFSKAIGDEKNERIARASLGSMQVFDRSLEQELKLIEARRGRGEPVDEEMANKMKIVTKQFRNVMEGFSHLSDDSQRHALIVYADAVQDLIAYLHRKRH